MKAMNKHIESPKDVDTLRSVSTIFQKLFVV